MSTTKLSPKMTFTNAASQRRMNVSTILRSTSVTRPQLRASRTRPPFVLFAQPDVEKAIKEAQEACEADESSKECATAWDNVEEVSAAAADQRDREAKKDPLEEYCEENPETDECRVYED